MTKTRFPLSRTLLIFVILLSTILINGCYMGLPSCDAIARNETGIGNIPFEQVFSESVGSLIEGEAWLESHPGLVIVTTPDEIQAASLYISQAGEEALRKIDYQNNFAVIAFIGVTGSIGNAFCITQVQQREQKITFFAHFMVPHIVGSAGASQYEIITLQRNTVESGEYSFNLHLTNHQSVRPGGGRSIVSIFRLTGNVATVSHELK